MSDGGLTREERVEGLVQAGFTRADAMAQALRDEAITEAVRAGGSLRAVGRDYGITHERVRQVVKMVDPGATLAGQTARAQAQVDAQQEDLPPLVEKVCVVCGEAFATTDPRRVTDKPECADTWARGARHRGSEAHSDNVARTILRHPQNYPPFKVAWARRRNDERELGMTG